MFLQEIIIETSSSFNRNNWIRKTDHDIAVCCCLPVAPVLYTARIRPSKAAVSQSLQFILLLIDASVSSQAALWAVASEGCEYILRSCERLSRGCRHVDGNDVRTYTTRVAHGLISGSLSWHVRGPIKRTKMVGNAWKSTQKQEYWFIAAKTYLKAEL